MRGVLRSAPAVQRTTLPVALEVVVEAEEAEEAEVPLRGAWMALQPVERRAHGVGMTGLQIKRAVAAVASSAGLSPAQALPRVNSRP